MRVTVAIPNYNGVSYVGDAIESVLRQTRQPDEILIVDDGSTDRSVDVITKYPVRLVRHRTNFGLAVARNSALAQAEGDILVYIDVDAVADPDLLISLLPAYEEASVGGAGGQGIEVNVKTVADRWRRAHAGQSHGAHEKDVEYLYGLCMSYRTYVLRQVGGFDESFSTNAEDMDVGFRVRAAGYRLRYIPDARVYHQRQDDAASLRRTMRQWYAAAYRARRKNNTQPWRLFAGVVRRLIMDPVQDLICYRDLALVPLSATVTTVKLLGLIEATRKYGEKR